MVRILSSLGVVAVCAMMVLSVGCGKKEDQAASSSTPSSSSSTAARSEQSTSAPSTASSATSTSEPSTAADYNAMAAQNAESLKAMNDGKDIEPITSETLKGFLPATLAEMKCTDSEAQHLNMMGVNVTSGNAVYEASDGEGELELTITDLGNVSGSMRMGMAGWAMVEVNKESGTGYEKTTLYQGYKAYEEYDRQERYGAVRVFAADRFMVEITGNNITMETIKQALGQVDVKKLVEAAK